MNKNQIERCEEVYEYFMEESTKILEKEIKLLLKLLRAERMSNHKNIFEELQELQEKFYDAYNMTKGVYAISNETIKIRKDIRDEYMEAVENFNYLNALAKRKAIVEINTKQRK